MQWWKKQESPCFSCGECQEKQKDYSVLKNEEKYMIEKVYDDNTLSFKEKGLYTAIYLNETMNVDQLVESGKDKADAVRSGLKKLIEKQYIKKSVSPGKKRKFRYGILPGN